MLYFPEEGNAQSLFFSVVIQLYIVIVLSWHRMGTFINVNINSYCCIVFLY